MPQATLPLLLSKNSQDKVLEFHKYCNQLSLSQWNIRNQLIKLDLAYIREEDLTSEHHRARVANTYGDSTKYQNITVPIVLPTVEAAVTYQASVFLTGNPLFACVSSPDYMDEAMQLETVIDNQAVKGSWIKQLLLVFRDGFKYNLGFLEVDWARQIVPSFETDISFKQGAEGKPKELLWQGNVLKRLDPYNTLFDTRVSLTELHTKGEFAGYTELMSRIQLKVFINSLPAKITANVSAAFNSSTNLAEASPSDTSPYYIPQINPEALLNPNLGSGIDWTHWAGLQAKQVGADINYQNYYQVSTLYCRIIPSEFNIKGPANNDPQVWKFIIVNHSVLIYAERLTNAHGYIPILGCQPLEDGLGFQTKPLAQNVAPFQSVASALMNSMIASRRRAISDRTLYDPSRISSEAMNSDNPSAKIPVRPSAYGKPVAESVYQFPYRDDQAPIISQELQQLLRFKDIVAGQNPVRQGQFVKGNKTREEFADVMANANGRDQMISMLLESQLFTPLKEILKINILQYQGPETIINRDQNVAIDIDPVALRKAVLNFKLSDGLLPVDKLINVDTLQVAMQVLGSSPQLGAGYQLNKLFSYLMKTQGAQIKDFEKSPEQIAYEQAMSQWQQMALTALDKGVAFNVPQPQPQQFGYLVPAQASA